MRYAVLIHLETTLVLISGPLPNFWLHDIPDFLSHLLVHKIFHIRSGGPPDTEAFACTREDKQDARLDNNDSTRQYLVELIH